MEKVDWQPQQYLKFYHERLQPAIDLLCKIEIENPERIIDIGCGPGTSTEIIHKHWKNASITGIDKSQSMLSYAKKTNNNIQWIQCDITKTDELLKLGAYDVAFSNAVLQWVPEHKRVIETLFSMVNIGGALAIQIPAEQDQPIYTEVLKLVTSQDWKSFFQELPEYPKHYTLQHYYDIAVKLSKKIVVWKTDYIHILDSHEEVVEWYKGSGLRTFMERLPNESIKNKFYEQYTEKLKKAYKFDEFGRVLLRFPRIFVILYKS